ncbi:hypothetical protein CRU87_06730 [Aliarcobacter trophiarum LMG 25534]|uniref:Uncharacterized protein n=1 Tax=Aliarcobacter trophiarum LMG 25534 TaxID=1032241 RepID=A0AAD0VLR5_9BACT|nr:hypothetical protein [Aliarcobacter trophiarum]AXK48588.1 hypothetical protein ATR_0719 [Aliarcobacter trophiarum LMG 25534]RXJ91078.1 hypothetical protein CRU87_06730 [Aliarcobacter trophiarum LMG 25534]
MQKVELENKIYFIGKDGSVYSEMQNVIEFIDEDNIKRYLYQLKDVRIGGQKNKKEAQTSGDLFFEWLEAKLTLASKK